jgi:flagellar L-ring protein precursor FlgH
VDGPLNELFINPTARRVGDIVTIEIVESAEASNEADTSTERSSSLSWTLEKLFGMEDKYPITTGSHPWYNPFSSLKGSMADSFDGKGATTRKGALTADITAMVTDVLPNGNLKIKGSREVTVNNERQYITLTGIIRPKDISTDNIVKSTRISEARIAYSGAGMITDRQKPGWLATILNKVSPF